ncbi:MAG: DUF6660 family protein [Ferruginibacter sp.]
MKIFVFIFSLYLIILPGITCAAAFGCTDEIQNSITQTDNHTDDEDEDCGSFCTCSCCMHIVTVSTAFQEMLMEKPVINPNHFFYTNISLPSNYFGNIWQPPRMS